MNILLTGGTAQLGTAFLTHWDRAGANVDVLTRQNRVNSREKSNIRYVKADLTRSDTLRQLTTPYDVVVHGASNPLDPETTDIRGSQNLLNVLKHGGGIPHFIYISIVGIDKLVSRYYQAKLMAESEVSGSGMPFTILRATQFHDFIYDRIYQFEDIDKEDWEYPLGLTFQTIDLEDVCRKIRDLIDKGPTNSIVEIGGPDVLSSEEIVRGYREVMKLPQPARMTEQLNAFQKLFTQGENLCPDDRYGTLTWKDFLKRKQNS